MEYKTAQQLHANRRAKERLGIHFNRHKAHEIILQIKTNKLRSKYTDNFGSWYPCLIDGLEAWVFYNRTTDRIVTVLHEMPENVRLYQEEIKRRSAERRRSYRHNKAKRDKEAALLEEQARLRTEEEARLKVYRKQMRLTRWIFHRLLEREFDSTLLLD